MVNSSIVYLIKLGVHLDQYVWDSNKTNLFYLLGTRNKIQIINLNFTLFLLKKALFVQEKSIKLKQNTLVINTDLENIKYDLEEKSNIFFINKKWICGFLTNHKHIKTYNPKKLKFYKNSEKMRVLPSFVFTTNNYSKSSLKEGLILDIPTAVLIDSSTKELNLHYMIPANLSSIWCRYLFFKTFVKKNLLILRKTLITLFKN